MSQYIWRVIKILSLAAVIILASTVLSSKANADPCYHVYVGLSVKYTGNSFKVEAWIKPWEVSWAYFRENCIPDHSGDYTNILGNIVVYGLQVHGSMKYNTGIDDEGGRFVFYAIIDQKNVGSFTISGDRARLVVYDLLYMYGQGYIDEVHISIPVEASKVFPSNYCEDYTAGFYTYKWYSESYSEASGYKAVEFALKSLRIHVEGLPPNYRVKIYVNGRYAGSINGGSSLPIILPFSENEVIIDVDPREISVGGDVKYVANAPITVSPDKGTVDITYSKYYRVRISLMPPEASSLPIEINGEAYSGSVDEFFEEGSVIHVSVPETEAMPGGDGVRKVYVFDKWSDGVTEPNRDIYVGGPVELTAWYTYKIQYRVDVAANVPGIEVSGGGWYDEGENAVVSAPEKVKRDGHLYVLSGWSTGDKGNSIGVEVHSPLSVEAIYEEYVLVNASSSCGTVEGAGYYRVGEPVSLKLRGVTDEGYCWNGRFYTKLQGWRVGGKTYPPTVELSFSAEEPVEVEPLFSGRYYKVSVGGVENIVPEGAVLPALKDKPVLGGLIVDRFKGYRRVDTGELLGRSPVVDDNMVLEPVYEKDYTYLFAAIALVAVLAGGFYMAAIRREKSVEELSKAAKLGKWLYKASAGSPEKGFDKKQHETVEEYKNITKSGNKVEEVSSRETVKQEKSVPREEEAGEESGKKVETMRVGTLPEISGSTVLPRGEIGHVNEKSIMFVSTSNELGELEKALRVGKYSCEHSLDEFKQTLLCTKDGEKYILKYINKMPGEKSIEILLSLNIPGIEPYLSIKENMLVRKYIEGTSLDTLFDIDKKEAIKLSLHLAKYIKSLHEQGIAHGGVKPGNIIISKGRVILTDHGYWMFNGNKKSPFNPPEGPGTPAGDVYMLGALIYWLLTMEEPSEIRADLLTEMGDLADIIMECLSKDPETRPSIEELIISLENALRSGNSSA